MVIVASKSVTIEVTAAVAEKGSITHVRFWDPSTKVWVGTAPKIVQGQDIFIQVLCRNDATFDEYLRVDITVTDPNGELSEQDYTADDPLTAPGVPLAIAPGATASVTFTWLAEKAGTYKVDLELVVV